MQTRTLACLPDASGYVLASIEGRCAIQYVEDSNTSLNFSFKCHRKVCCEFLVSRTEVG